MGRVAQTAAAQGVSEVGTVPPRASHVITVTLTAHTAGPLRIPMYVKIVGREVPFPLVVRPAS